MSLHIVEDDDGNVLDSYGEFDNSVINAMLYDEPIGAECDVDEYGGHVVELIEAPEKIVVSEEESKMLKKAKNTAVWRPASVIAGYAYDNTKDPDDEAILEDRLMRAYVIGWTVEKPKRYLVRVPHANRHYYYQKCDSGEVIPVWDMETEPPTQFTVAEIEHYGLQDCERIEVTDDEV